jgi:hypothetical protein
MARRRPIQKATAKMTTLPAPVGGWNARDPVPEMKPTDAISMDNWLIDQFGDFRTRGGSLNFATNFTSAVETLMSYSPPSGISKLFASAGGNIYDITGGGTIGSAVVTGLVNSRLEYTNITTLGGSYLVVGNGAATPRVYNGTWASFTTTTGTAPITTFTSPTVMVSRLWWIENDSLNAWYGETASISGTLSKFPMGAVFTLGGELVAQAAWTRDGGSGPEDYTVFVSSRGEVLVYSGSDPTSATAWQKVGVFKIANPIGRRCVMKAGADLAILTTQGVVLLGQVLDSNVSGQSAVAVTNKVLGAFGNAATVGSSLFGWQMAEYANQGLIFVNVPIQEGSVYEQYVLTVAKGTWARFKGLNGTCWVWHENAMYFGGVLDLTTSRAAVIAYSPYLESDNGKRIDCFVQTAFTDLGSGQNKQFLMARPLMQGPKGYTPSLALKLEYDTSPPTIQNVAPVSQDNGIPFWGVWEWDTQYWGYVRVPTAQWVTLSGIGQRASIAFSVSTDVALSFNAIDLTYQVGGAL